MKPFLSNAFFADLVRNYGALGMILFTVIAVAGVWFQGSTHPSLATCSVDDLSDGAIVQSSGGDWYVSSRLDWSNDHTEINIYKKQ